ncbi:MAG: hypothetical protein FWB72_06250 [Firmicutes bacterium]|nr:hypothetical protein [Bacillota bacterium]
MAIKSSKKKLAEIKVKDLFKQAREAQENNTSLKDVFINIANKYNKQPNSIRNLYYLKIREYNEWLKSVGGASGQGASSGQGGGASSASARAGKQGKRGNTGQSRKDSRGERDKQNKGKDTHTLLHEKLKQLGIQDIKKSEFVTFGADEVLDLVKHILREQGKGKSVRSVTYEIGGDKQGMLRYQNKYRSTLLNNPPLVERAMKELKAEGANFYNPYKRHTFNKALSIDFGADETKLSYLPSLITIASTLENIKGASPKQFFISLESITKTLATNYALQEELRGEITKLKEENKGLRDELRDKLTDKLTDKRVTSKTSTHKENITKIVSKSAKRNREQA